MFVINKTLTWKVFKVILEFLTVNTFSRMVTILRNIQYVDSED